MGRRRLPCRPRRTLCVFALLLIVGSAGFLAELLPPLRTFSELFVFPSEIDRARSESELAGLPPSAPTIDLLGLSSPSEHYGVAQEAAGTPHDGGGLEHPASGSGSMCLSARGPVADISSEQLPKMEQCLAIPPQVVRKPSKASLDATANAPHHVPMPGMQTHPRTAAAIFVGKRNVMSMNLGLKDRGVAILASIYNVSRMSSDSRKRLERADFIYTNDREQMRSVRLWQDRALATAARTAAVGDVFKAAAPVYQHVITNTVEAFFSHGFTSKDGLPQNLRRLYAAAGCEMGAPGAAALMPPTLTLPSATSDAAAIKQCDRWFAARGVLRGGDMHQGFTPRLLLKPTLGSQGKGITLHANLSTLLRDTQRGWPCDPTKDQRFGGAATVTGQTARQKKLGLYVVQSYIEPLLLHGRKFDMRMYVLVASTNPVVLFWREGYIRRALQRYDPTAPFAGNEGMHITNTHRQKKFGGYRPKSHIWSMAQLREYLATHIGAEALRLFNRRMSTFVPWAARTVVQALLESPSGQPTNINGRMRDSVDWARNGTYQLIGLDFMVNDQMEFAFIEGNPRPGLDQETKWQKNYMVDMVGEMVELVFEVQTGAPLALGKTTVRSVARHRMWSGESVGVAHAAYGNWRMLWHENWESCGSVNYSPLDLCPGLAAEPDQETVSRTDNGASASSGSIQAYPTGPREEVLGARAPPRGTSSAWPCLYPHLAMSIPYDSYPAGVRRRDAEEDSSKAPTSQEACIPAVREQTNPSALASGLKRVIIIGTSTNTTEGGSSGLMNINAARQHNCACLHKVLQSVAPSDLPINIIAPTTPASLMQPQDWRAQLVAQGFVASTNAKLLKQDRLSDLATALSHIKVWSEFAAGSFATGPRLASESLLVLEDDASLPDTFCWADLTRRLSTAPQGWSMISLFEFDPYKNRGKKKRTPKKWDSTPLKICSSNAQGTTEEHGVASASNLRVRHHALGMVGYVISREGASRLLKLVLPLNDKAIDQVLTDIVRTQQLKPDSVFVSHPPLVHHDYILGSQRREQNKAASQQHAAVGADDAVVELALANELGINSDGSLLAATTAGAADATASSPAADTGDGVLERNSMALEAEGFAVETTLADDEVDTPDIDAARVEAEHTSLEWHDDAPLSRVHAMTKSQLEAEVLAMRAAVQQRAG